MAEEDDGDMTGGRPDDAQQLRAADSRCSTGAGVDVSLPGNRTQLGISCAMQRRCSQSR
jgi:hypothetical protein